MPARPEAAPVVAPVTESAADAGPSPAPFLPTAERVVAEPAPEPVFDARAMVESQKHVNKNPAYGAMPKATPESLEAARKLREQAAKKRRRNKVLGWFVGVAFLGVVGAGGYFGYQAYQDEQDDRATTVDDGDANSTLDELLDDDTSGAPADSDDSGLLDAVDDARAAVDELGAGGGDGGGLTLADARSFAYDVVVYDGAAPGAPYREHQLSSDVVTDTLVGVVGDSISGAGERIVVDGEWWQTIGADRIVHRYRRTAASLDPAPDMIYGGPLIEVDFLPLAAQPYTTVADTDADLSAILRSGNVTVTTYLLDGDAFLAADPAGFDRWIGRITRGLDPATMIEPDVHQVAAEPDDGAAELATFEFTDLGAVATVEVPGETTLVALATDNDGFVEAALVVSPTADLRLVYSLFEPSSDAILGDTTDRVWLDVEP